MANEFILQGKVLWSYAYEYANISAGKKLTASLVSFTGPLHNHSGEIALTDSQLIIEGDADLIIPLQNINEIYLGFDDVFSFTSVKNLGALWQPLRIEIHLGNRLECVYLIIDYNGLLTHNKRWFEHLTTILQ